MNRFSTNSPGSWKCDSVEEIQDLSKGCVKKVNKGKRLKGGYKNKTKVKTPVRKKSGKKKVWNGENIFEG